MCLIKGPLPDYFLKSALFLLGVLLGVLTEHPSFCQTLSLILRWDRGIHLGDILRPWSPLKPFVGLGLGFTGGLNSEPCA